MRHAISGYVMEEINPGIILTGRYLDEDGDPVGSFLLHHGGECLVVETPPDPRMPVNTEEAIRRLGNPRLTCVTTTHCHWDHFSRKIASELRALPSFKRRWPVKPEGELSPYWRSEIGGEPVYFIQCPKHSRTDQVIAFRGMALTGDIELGTPDSVTDEVQLRQRRRSLEILAAFPERTGYGIHALCSSHLNDVRYGMGDWRRVVMGASAHP